MSGDYSRDSFDALRDHAGVFLQQGRAVLDSDWNEMVEMFERRIRTGAVDTIGRAVVPRETILGFEIRFAASGAMEIGRGRLYLDGMLVECHGAANFDGASPTLPDPVFDRAREAGSNPVIGGPEGVLDEMIPPEAGDFLSYLSQPYWPTPEPLPQGGAHLAYLVAWRREVTPIENPDLLEPALGGLDTTTRWQTVWQVRVHPAPAGATCDTPDEDIPGWVEEIAPSTARLSTGTVDVEDPEDPCLIPPTEGYSGLENQFYRVELHNVGAPGANGDPPDQTDATFKFSRENASVASSVAGIGANNQSVVVSRIGRDEILRFRPGDWVELTDDIREFNHRSGVMLRVSTVSEETREVFFEAPIDDDPANADLAPSGVGDDTVTARRTRLIRWDQQGVVRRADGTEWFDLDGPGSAGVIPVPPPGVELMLESGITVSFGAAAGPGRFREMDHWRFAARTAGATVERLRAAPPDGVQRHYTRLAVVNLDLSPADPLRRRDCRSFWPPEFEGGDTIVQEGCYCTICVTAEEHNSGARTIQQAIADLPLMGGTVCLAAGIYNLSEPITISNRNAIKLTGQGLGAMLFYRGRGGAIRIETSNDIQLERFSLFVRPGEGPTGGPLIAHGVTCVNTMLTALRRLAVLVLGDNPEDRIDHGVAFDGLSLGAKVEECLVIAPIALGSRSTFGLDEDDDLTFAVFGEFRALDNILFGGRTAVQFGRVAANISTALFSRNLLLAGSDGVRINWAEIPAASLSIDASTVFAGRTGMVIGADTAHVADCEISAGQDGDGVRLEANLVPEARTDAQIVGNTIMDATGAGVRIDGLHDNLLITRNLIQRCDEAGIATTPEARIAHVAIENNVVEDVAGLGAELGAVGILVTTALTGQVIGNRVERVGGQGRDGLVYAGIAVQGSGSVDVAHNIVTSIGPNRAEARSAGVLAAQPYLGLTIADNQIAQIGVDPDGGAVAWRAIQIGAQPPPAGEAGEIDAGGDVSALPSIDGNAMAFAAVGGALYRASAESLVVVSPNQPSLVAVRGNQARANRALFGPMISLFDPTALSLDFSHNQCDLRAEGELRDAVVAIGARRLVCGSNAVTHLTNALSMRLVTGPQGAATPIGNITSGRILLNGAGLPAPFNALNLQA